MKVYRKIVYQWSEELGHYTKVYEDSYNYSGPVDHVCGATSAQNQILGQQTGFATQVASQAGTIFGNASSVFNSLQSSLLPTINKGPNQAGFSAGELAARNAGVVQTGAQAAANAKSAIGNAGAAQGGGNTGLTAGASTVNSANALADISQGTATELNKVQQQNYEVGRQEYNDAIKGEEGSTEVFNPATSAANAGSEAFKGAADTANQVASQQNSWVNAAIGALGSVAGAATGGLIKNLGNQTPSDPNSPIQPTGSGEGSGYGQG